MTLQFKNIDAGMQHRLVPLLAEVQIDDITVCSDPKEAANCHGLLVIPRLRGSEAITALLGGAKAVICHEDDDGVWKRALRRLQRDHGRDQFHVDGIEGWVELSGQVSEEVMERFAEFASVLNGLLLNQDESQLIRMAVEELGHNAIEWGNKGDPTKKLDLRYALFKDELVIYIADEGEGFDVDSTEFRGRDAFDNRQKAGKRLGGFGITLAEKAMDEVRYSERGNAVIMVKRLSALAE